jgi:hypothetical protein
MARRISVPIKEDFVMPKCFRSPLPLLVLAVALAVSALPAARADEPTSLRVCLYAGFAPFASKDKDGNWVGWDVDFLKGFAAEMNRPFEVVETDFNGIWLQPGEAKCDIAGTGISDTADRRKATGKKGCWSTTYYHVLRAFVVRTQDFTRLAKIEDLKGKKVIVTQGSTANTDVCYRMQLSKPQMYPCKKADGDHPCPNFLQAEEKTKQQDPNCVFIEYPRKKDERNAAFDVAWSLNADEDEGFPFAYGGGYGSVQALACDSGGCPYPTQQALATVWPHCNMAVNEKRAYQPYAEPFSFVVAAADTGLWKALNDYIDKHLDEYEGTPIPIPDPPCDDPWWTPKPDKATCPPQ